MAECPKGKHQPLSGKQLCTSLVRSNKAATQPRIAIPADRKTREAMDERRTDALKNKTPDEDDDTDSGVHKMPGFHGIESEDADTYRDHMAPTVEPTPAPTTTVAPTTATTMAAAPTTLPTSPPTPNLAEWNTGKMCPVRFGITKVTADDAFSKSVCCMMGKVLRFTKMLVGLNTCQDSSCSNWYSMPLPGADMDSFDGCCPDKEHGKVLKQNACLSKLLPLGPYSDAPLIFIHDGRLANSIRICAKAEVAVVNSREACSDAKSKVEQAVGEMKKATQALYVLAGGKGLPEPAQKVLDAQTLGENLALGIDALQ